ncbi:LOW QUALITY PROTEIN: Glycosyl hydrolase [Phytophthora palmivora]|uniref:Glycosyl hydrolase n=1 Tax=Phytophthora palmivora TaxID=4796 RepID=A0A2P4Y694_9STRA|nr:LOW QUALITY PROTEIN: Glycosyl hydrolase [Phytophthora palmivora]
MSVAPSFDPLPSSPQVSMLPTINANALSIRNGHFIDAQGRVRLLRGVNLGGSSKLPFGYQHTDRHSSSNFFDGARAVSFVNRPFPLAEAPSHFARLQRWGLTLLRFIVTWEAIEHGGPGVYDREYLKYIRDIIAIAADYGLLIYVDPHQDVWSRWTGGDGAPMWTLEDVGLDPRNFEVTKAALCVETCGLEVSNYPKMIWPTNYFKMACATMFSLFWGGSKCAPSCLPSGWSAGAGISAVTLFERDDRVGGSIERIDECFGTMNEPSSGYLGLGDLSKHFHHGELKYDLAPTPFQGMALADGYQQVIQRWSNGANQHVLGRPDELVTVDPNGVRAWQQGRRCIWRDEGIWDVDSLTGQPVLLRPDHFAGIMFGRDCYVPFAARFAERVRSILPHILLFVELPPLEFSIDEFPEIDETLIPRAVNATHWYDGVTLFLQAWRPYFTVDPRTKRPAFGYAAVRRTHLKQLAGIKVYGSEQMNNAPTLIGETGIPFNMHGGKAFRNGDFRSQVGALDNTVSCLEASMVSFTLWCYTSDNCNGYGDQWNLEDLSLISMDKPIRSGLQLSVPERDACARAVQAFARPYATRIAGTPSKSEFILERVRYELEYVSDPAKSNEASMHPTEIFVPQLQYPRGYSVETSDGHFSVQSHDGWDVVSFLHDPSKANHWFVITTKDTSIEKRRRDRIAMIDRRYHRSLQVFSWVACAAMTAKMVLFTEYGSRRGDHEHVFSGRYTDKQLDKFFGVEDIKKQTQPNQLSSNTPATGKEE